MIQAMVSGHVGRDAELSDQGGTAVLRFSVASNDRAKGGEKRTTWVACSLFGKRAMSLASYLTKGTRVAIVGALRVWVSEGEPRIALDVGQIDLLGSPSSGERPRPEQSGGGSSVGAIPNDDLPFALDVTGEPLERWTRDRPGALPP